VGRWRGAPSSTATATAAAAAAAAVFASFSFFSSFVCFAVTFAGLGGFVTGAGVATTASPSSLSIAATMAAAAAAVALGALAFARSFAALPARGLAAGVDSSPTGSAPMATAKVSFSLFPETFASGAGAALRRVGFSLAPRSRSYDVGSDVSWGVRREGGMLRAVYAGRRHDERKVTGTLQTKKPTRLRKFLAPWSRDGAAGPRTRW
jgi:hypothetical protein